MQLLLLPCRAFTPAAPPAAAFVRVRPAPAGEGRYFVRVPPGTNAGNYVVQEPQPVDAAALESGGAPDDGLDDAQRTALFLRFLVEQEEEGYEGNFGGELCITYASTFAYGYIGGTFEQVPKDLGRPLQREWISGSLTGLPVHGGGPSFVC